MSAITAWQRLEPSARTEELEPGLQARVADPLWLLARQWQFGEFQGEDVGSPASVRAQGQAMSLRYWRPGVLPASGDGSVGALPLSDVPLEAIVECEAVTAGPSAARLAAEAGLHFLRLLSAEGVGALREDFRRAFRLAGPVGPGDEQAMRYVRVLCARSLDGRALRAALPKTIAPPPQVPTITAAQQPGVLRALKGYVAWYDGRALEPGSAAGAWIPERMEYAFAVSAGAVSNEVVLEAKEYPGGELNWTAFDLRPGAQMAQSTATAGITSLDATLIPSSITFHGAPRARWWEIEDAGVDIGALDAGPADIVRLVLAEFALLHSDDWFMIPIDIPAGSVARMTTLAVTDTFGVVTPLRPSAAIDGASSPWRMFTLTGDPATGAAGSPWLFVAPTLARGVQGEPIEELALLRDEMADVAWGVERVVESVDGRPLDRFEAWLAKRRTSAPATASTSGVARYRLAPEVPEHWFPLVPVKTGQRSIGLRRGRVLLDAQVTPPTPLGRLLEPGGKLVIKEEEVPSEGVTVTRAWQLARGADGSSVAWVGRRKRPGRSARAPGLVFDDIEK